MSITETSAPLASNSYSVAGTTSYYPKDDDSLSGIVSSADGLSGYLTSRTQSSYDLGSGNLVASNFVLISPQGEWPQVYQWNNEACVVTWTAQQPTKPGAEAAGVPADSDSDYMLSTMNVTSSGFPAGKFVAGSLTGGSLGAGAVASGLGLFLKFYGAGQEAATNAASAAGNVASAAENAVEESAVVDGVELLGTVAKVAGGVGVALGIAAFVAAQLEASFNLNMEVINRSSTDFALWPGRYTDGGQLSMQSTSTVSIDGTETGYLPHRQNFPLGDGNGNLAPYEQSALYSFAYDNNNDKWKGIGTLLQLQEMTSYDVDSGTGTVDSSSDASVFLSVNFPYKINREKAVFHTFRNPNNLSMKDLYASYEWRNSDDPPVNGSSSTTHTNVDWRVDTVQPANSNDSWTINLVMVITDK